MILRNSELLPDFMYSTKLTAAHKISMLKSRSHTKATHWYQSPATCSLFQRFFASDHRTNWCWGVSHCCTAICHAVAFNSRLQASDWTDNRKPLLH